MNGFWVCYADEGSISFYKKDSSYLGMTKREVQTFPNLQIFKSSHFLPPLNGLKSCGSKSIPAARLTEFLP